MLIRAVSSVNISSILLPYFITSVYLIIPRFGVYQIGDAITFFAHIDDVFSALPPDLLFSPPFSSMVTF